MDMGVRPLVPRNILSWSDRICSGVTEECEYERRKTPPPENRKATVVLVISDLNICINVGSQNKFGRGRSANGCQIPNRGVGFVKSQKVGLIQPDAAVVGRSCIGYDYTPILTPESFSPGGCGLYYIALMVGYFDVWLFSLLDTVVQQELAYKALY